MEYRGYHIDTVRLVAKSTTAIGGKVFSGSTVKEIKSKIDAHFSLLCHRDWRKTKMRSIKTVQVHTDAYARIYKDAEWGEFIVKFYEKEGDIFLKLGDSYNYHTDDLDDAIEIAEDALMQMNPNVF